LRLWSLALLRVLLTSRICCVSVGVILSLFVTIGSDLPITSSPFLPSRARAALRALCLWDRGAHILAHGGTCLLTFTFATCFLLAFATCDLGALLCALLRALLCACLHAVVLAHLRRAHLLAALPWHRGTHILALVVAHLLALVGAHIIASLLGH